MGLQHMRFSSPAGTFRRLVGALIAVAIVLWPFAANAETEDFPGQWRQMVSNAGTCGTCWLAIKQHGPILKVSSNNGWFAFAHADLKTGSTTAAGIGRWSENVSGHYGGKPFDVRFVIVDKQLYLDMIVLMDDGTKQAIRAIFDKDRPGKTARRVMAKS
ncbi:hypothetical protein ASD02_17845 [Ensifer sp. Root1252]|jgi:hypothetical protein|nr:hypothetical protein ASD02_17845 [Ensifer sp. Root1252]KQW56157.1 hypothetical protein ASD03_17275 [Ensifer sp. Root127]KQY61523.1 hypothetical protein ASD52_16770 [Ensifer sp. Root142]KRC55237.1 hypothetical protein ASE32_21155 [Ensifer sp. Root231]KRC87061.1 hypothetical protein ASE47_15315 [Ensifer sp. Root258]OMQ43844.1 hypothetical protein BKP54_15805 [Ensifer sp. 1H6]